MRGHARPAGLMHAALAAALPFVLACAADARAQAADAAEPAIEAPALLPDEPEPIRFRVVVDAPRPYEKMLENGLDIVRWQHEQRVTLPVLERLVTEARRSAAEALAADGYFSADVQSRIERTTPNEAVVRFSVKLGPRTTVRGVDLAFEGAALADPEGRKRVAVVRERWRLPQGEAFRQSEWDAAKSAALVQLGRGRFPAASIAESEARVDAEANQADLKLKLDSGPVFKAGPVSVSGLQRYPAAVVENMYPFKPGEAYDAVKLDLYQRRLLESGYFNAVNFAIDPDPAQAESAPLRVTVLEAPSQRIDTGIAFSTDTRLGITVDYTNANVFDRAWRFRPRLDVNMKEQRVNVTLDTPPRPGGVWNTYTTRFERRDIENQMTGEFVLGAARNWGLERTPSQVGLAMHLEHQTVSGSTSENNYALYGHYRKSFRETDDIVAPRRGFFGIAEIGAAVPELNTRDFARAYSRLNWLIPLGPRNDVLLRGEAGVVLAGNRRGIPTSFLFRTGGDQTIRGYSFESIGVPEGNAIVGGRYLVLASAEYTRWLTESIGAAVFVDSGDAFDQRSDFLLATGYGAGVRWRSPVGPFRADIAYGQRAHKLRLHFSVGFNL